jgi:large subunit ribosomal protein L28
MCGKKPVAGRSYARRGLAKSKGGVGRKVTGITKRRFCPNIQIVRIADEKGAIRRARICTKCLRTGLRKGSLRKAVRRSRAPKEIVAPPDAAMAQPLEAEPRPDTTDEPTGEADIEVPPEANAIDGGIDGGVDEAQSE